MIYDYEIVELLDTAHAQKVVTHIWESKYNVSASIFAASSIHNLLFNFNHCRYDLEKKLRFNAKKDLAHYATHGFQFETWRSSGKSRYFTFALGFFLNSAIMHWILLNQIKSGNDLSDNREQILLCFNTQTKSSDLYNHWISKVHNYQE